jgi:hypothetical protein
VKNAGGGGIFRRGGERGGGELSPEKGTGGATKDGETPRKEKERPYLPRLTT